jgi:lipopolysaccharide/colanic/teichoic acid biosynthesis glycosyltransferase/SAM-dependent methyltransferase/NAD-dependent dihydropyrimidine dehydrogenase PreA subunit
VTGDSCCQTANQPAVSDKTRIVVNDPELRDRLDRLFTEHFRVHRQPTLRITINHAFKRLLDIGASFLGMLLCWPILVVAGIATSLDTGRPIFYSQIRRIRFGRQARIHKMRTLVVGADRKLDKLVSIKQCGRFLNIAKDVSSYTRVGRWLERLWIVELPQIWNVFLGQMSLVGNRPIPDYVIDALGPTAEVIERFASPQGLTGYVQIIGRDNVTDQERIRLEYEYSRIFEKGDVFLEDLRIMALTVMSYLGFGRPRTAADFLNRDRLRDEGSRARAGGGVDEDTRVAVSGVGGTCRPPSDRLACPTCYVAEGGCTPERCNHECVRSCRYGGVTLGPDNRPVFQDACIACSACLLACPMHAIDKSPLRHVDGSYTCVRCTTEYRERDGVLDLLPRNTRVGQSPFFDLYEKEYLRDNPQLHLEDTDWKLSELLPLLGPPGTYRNLLDVGCGAGTLGRRIGAELRVPDRTASDWSREILAFARGHDHPGTYLRADAAYLPFRNATYDLAMMIDVIEHQQKPEQVLRELHRVARHLLLRTPMEDCTYERLRRRHKDLFRESSGHVVYYSRTSIQAQLKSNGWDVRRESIHHIAWVHWKRYVFGTHPMKVRISALARVVLRFMLPKFAYRRLFIMNYNALCASRFAPADGQTVREE